MNTSWKRDDAWARGHAREVADILIRHRLDLIRVRQATDEEDQKRATDFVIETRDGDVALRIRDDRRTFRHWTIRLERESGAKTELEKLREGHARWYLYCWCTHAGSIGDYVIVDLDRVRSAGMLDTLPSWGAESRTATADRGLTYFTWLTVGELRAAGALRVDECHTPDDRPRGDYVPPPSVKSSPPPASAAPPVKPTHQQRELFPRNVHERETS